MLEILIPQVKTCDSLNGVERSASQELYNFTTRSMWIQKESGVI